MKQKMLRKSKILYVKNAKIKFLHMLESIVNIRILKEEESLIIYQ